jgi:HD-GYP domain-containing protein (c-di-GMP phosphodiesterase class II)
LVDQSRFLQQRVAALEKHLRELNAIGISLSTEKNLDRLLEKILSKSREMVAADSGSLYLIEQTEAEKSSQELSGKLRFKLAQNDSVAVPFSEFTLPISRQSIGGFVAIKGTSLLIDDVYELTGKEEYKHNRDFDQKYVYRTKSMLVVPMKNQNDEIIGVLQLINKKKNWQSKLVNSTVVQNEVLCFDATDLELVESLASQASVAIENARLYQDIQNLFEGFIRASVSAIESRDPTTSGHSERVAKLTCGLAEVVSKHTAGPYRDVRFDEKDMKELRYASLLHDFGKIGVREEVLVKAKKLYQHDMELIKYRFDLIRSTLENDYNRRKLDYLLQQTREKALGELSTMDVELQQRLKEIDDYLAFVIKSNEPTVLPDGAFGFLSEIAARKFSNISGELRNYLTEDEVRLLSIRKGSLSDQERLAIESHVTHSYNFLKQIPWTKDLRRVPSIAYAHHEKLNGTGYPLKITSEQIPLQSKIMTITDIFDALSARDRPYKRAVPVAKALDILKMEVDDGNLDRDLYTLFIDGKVYKLVIDE